MVDWRDGQFDLPGEDAFSKYFVLEDVDSVNDYPQVSSVYPHIPRILTSPIYDVAVYREGPLNIAHRFFRGKLARLGGYWSAIDGASMMGDQSIEPGAQLADRKDDALCYIDFSPQFEVDVFKRHLRLKGEWQAKVDSFAVKYNLGGAVGLHVRYTDKKPTEQLDRLIENLRANYSGRNIFLATDNAEVLDLLTNQGFQIISTEKFLPEDANEGLHQYALRNNRPDLAARVMEESILDMWLLSKCDVLMYQGNSSFSKISKALRTDSQKSIDWLNDC